MLSNLQARISKPGSHNDAVKLFPAKIKQAEEGGGMQGGEGRDKRGGKEVGRGRGRYSCSGLLGEV